MRSNIPAGSVPVALWLVGIALAIGVSPAFGQEETPPARAAQPKPDQPGPDDKGPAAKDQELELCGEATGYEARQDGEVVTIAAMGSHRTAGFKVVLEQSPLRIFPPQFLLKHDPPDGPVAQVITPFRARETFKAGGQVIQTVIVHDAKGRQEVKVRRGSPGAGGKQTPSGQSSSARRGGPR